MANDTQRGILCIEDDFDADLINSAAGNGVRWLTATSTGATAIGIATVSGNCAAQGVTAAAANSRISLAHGLLAWRAQEGYSALETRLHISDPTNVCINVGFNDDTQEGGDAQAANAAHIPVSIGSGDALTTNASTFAGVVFDTGADNDVWHTVWVDDDADTAESVANRLFSGLAPVANEFFTVRIVLYDNGSGNGVIMEASITDHFGRLYQKRFITTVDRDAALAPYIGVISRAAAARTVTIDYVRVEKSRIN